MFNKQSRQGSSKKSPLKCVKQKHNKEEKRHKVKKLYKFMMTIGMSFMKRRQQYKILKTSNQKYQSR